MYYATTALYSNPLARIRLNNTYTDWFETLSGVRQGDTYPQRFLEFI